LRAEKASPTGLAFFLERSASPRVNEKDVTSVTVTVSY